MKDVLIPEDSSLSIARKLYILRVKIYLSWSIPSGYMDDLQPDLNLKHSLLKTKAMHRAEGDSIKQNFMNGRNYCKVRSRTYVLIDFTHYCTDWNVLRFHLYKWKSRI